MSGFKYDVINIRALLMIRVEGTLFPKVKEKALS
jgi:hypothetical protein